jgi:hypothetical protein
MQKGKPAWIFEYQNPGRLNLNTNYYPKNQGIVYPFLRTAVKVSTIGLPFGDKNHKAASTGRK